MAGSCHCQKHEVLECSYFIATLQDLASLAKAFPTLASTFTIGVIITNDYNNPDDDGNNDDDDDG